MKINGILLLVAVAFGLANATSCDDENSQDCKDAYTRECGEYNNDKFEKCKARVLELSKSGILTTDGKAHLNEILGDYSSQNMFLKIEFSKTKKDKLLYIIEGGWFDITKINEYTYAINYPEFDDETGDWNYDKVEKQECFAYDIKRKALTFLEKCGENRIKTSIPKTNEL